MLSHCMLSLKKQMQRGDVGVVIRKKSGSHYRVYLRYFNTY